MKATRFFLILLCLTFCGNAFGQTQDMDKELADLTEKLATKIQSVSKKKLTVLDFTDLDGTTTDLGKYVAEQLTVNLVSGDRKFTVVDRANLRKLLAEHQLTAKGLVDPENAKKFAGLSGVDALIVGTVVPMSPNIKLTAKIISTENGDIIGAGQCSFKSDETVQPLLARKAPQSDAGSVDEEPAKPKLKSTQVSGGFAVAVENALIAYDPRDRGDRMLVNLVLLNTNSSKTLAVGLYCTGGAISGYRATASMTGADGSSWEPTDATGIRVASFDPQNLTAIEPQKEIKVALRFRPPGSYSETLTSLRLHLEFTLNSDYKESQYDNYIVDKSRLAPKCKIVSTTIDIPMSRK